MPLPPGRRLNPFFVQPSRQQDTIGSSAVVSKPLHALLEKACTTGVLRLANRNLTQLPADVFNLEAMDYQGKRWWEEQNLTVVDFSQNQIACVPPEMESIMGTVRSIIGCYNLLTSFPLNVLAACCCTLTKLDLSHNKLKSFLEISPDDVARGFPVFQSLQEIDVSHNELASVCGFASFFPSLANLDVSHNKLVSFENRVFVSDPFPALRSMKANNNQLAKMSPHLQFDTSTTLTELDLSCNQLTLAEGDASSRLFGPSLQILNLKQNRIAALQFEHFFCPKLKELLLGNNQIREITPDAFCRCLDLSFVDLSNNKITNVEAVTKLPLLSRLDIQNNDISMLPPQLALNKNLTNMVLDGNPLRSIRREIVAKGTLEVLKFLRSRLSLADNDDEAKAKAPAIAQLNLSSAAPPMRAKSEEEEDRNVHAYGRRSHQMKMEDRPYATEFNVVGPPKNEALPENAKLIAAGARAGGCWDLSFPEAGPQRGFRVTGMAERGSSSQHDSNIPQLPATVDLSLNFAVLHAPEEDKFRSLVTVVRAHNQPAVQQFSLSFLQPFPAVREISLAKCKLLSTISDGDAAPQTLQSILLPSCSFNDGSLPSLAALFRSTFAPQIVRLDFAMNKFTQLPDEVKFCGSLRYLNLSSNGFVYFPQCLFLLPRLQELQLDHNKLCEFYNDTPGEKVGIARKSWPEMQILNLAYNNLSNVPFTLGNLQQLQQLSLEGNCVKWLRPAILQKGTAAICQYLRDKIQ